MFGRKKKSIVVNVVNTEEIAPQEDNTEKVYWGANASVLVDNVVVGGVILIGSYFLADALRSVVIHTAVTKITPTIVVEAAKK